MNTDLGGRMPHEYIVTTRYAKDLATTTEYRVMAYDEDEAKMIVMDISNTWLEEIVDVLPMS